MRSAGASAGAAHRVHARGRLAAAVVLGGIAAGLTGWFFQRLLYILQRVAFGLGPGAGRAGGDGGGWLDVRSGPSLLDLVEAADPWRRVAVLAVAGLVGGVSWFLYFRRGHTGVDVAATADGRDAPLPAAFWHTTTQVVVVAMGASIGREAAPREMAASLSAWLSDRLDLSPEDRRTIVACGAGAGLAAVYSIPLSGAVFALEVVLARVTPRTAWPALVMSGLAVLVADGWTFGPPFYDVPEIVPTVSLTVWALVAGPLIGALGHWFGVAVRRCESARPRDARLLWTLPVAFAAVGLVSVWVPSVLGNGQSTAQIAFDTPAGVTGAGAMLLAGVVLAKLAATLATIRSGAWGGTLQPSVALGAGVGALTGVAWGALWSAVSPGAPATQLAAFAVVGAAAFLATSWRAPLTALALVLEFTHQGPAVLLPALLAIGMATAVARWLSRRETGRLFR